MIHECISGNITHLMTIIELLLLEIFLGPGYLSFSLEISAESLQSCKKNITLHFANSHLEKGDIVLGASSSSGRRKFRTQVRRTDRRGHSLRNSVDDPASRLRE